MVAGVVAGVVAGAVAGAVAGVVAGVGWLSPQLSRIYCTGTFLCPVVFFSCFNFVLHELQWACQTWQTILSYRIQLEQNSE